MIRWDRILWKEPPFSLLPDCDQVDAFTSHVKSHVLSLSLSILLEDPGRRTKSDTKRSAEPSRVPPLFTEPLPSYPPLSLFPADLTRASHRATMGVASESESSRVEQSSNLHVSGDSEIRGEPKIDGCLFRSDDRDHVLSAFSCNTNTTKRLDPPLSDLQGEGMRLRRLGVIHR